MASHTYCRAKPIKQQSCSASDALATVKDLLASGTSSLADDVKANLYKVESDLQVLQGFPEVINTAPRQQPAATSGKTAKAGEAAGADKKERKKDKRHKEAKDGAAATDGVKADGEGVGKRKVEKGKDEDGKEKRKKKKHKTEA